MSQDTSQSQVSSRRLLLTLLPVAVVLVLLGLSYRFGESWFRTTLFDAVKASTPFWVFVFLPIIVPLIGGIVLVIASLNKKASIAGALLAVFGLVNLLVPGVGLTGSQALRNGHDSLEMIARNVSNVDSAHPEYLPRVNSIQAAKIVEQLLNDPAISSTTQAQYTRVDDAPAWCVGGLGHRDKLGRQYTTTAVCITDDGALHRAAFEGLVPSFDGNYSTNIHKRVAELRPGHSVADEDLRFYIEDGKPFMVTPSTTRTAGMHPITVPGGVFVFDQSGSVIHDTEVTADEYQIAVLPYKVARDLRASLNSRAGYWCSTNLNKGKCLAKNTPYEQTGTINGEEVVDVNASNSTEFVLRRADGSIAMVTPLTNYGKGLSITAYLDITVDSVTSGQIPSATLYTGVNEVSHKIIVQALTPAYTSDLTWLTELDASADNATASRIYEITPTKPGAMRLTIGTETNPQYVVEINASLQEGSTEFSWCISTDGKSPSSRRPIECRKASDGEAPIGTLRGLNVSQNTDPADGSSNEQPADPSGPVASNDLSQLSAAELIQLIKDAAAELEKR